MVFQAMQTQSSLLADGRIKTEITQVDQAFAPARLTKILAADLSGLFFGDLE
jgi:hypothetical protein